MFIRKIIAQNAVHNFSFSKIMLKKLENCIFRGDFLKWVDQILDLKITGQEKESFFKKVLDIIELKGLDGELVEIIKAGAEKVDQVNLNNGNKDEEYGLAEVKKLKNIKQAEKAVGYADFLEGRKQYSGMINFLLEACSCYKKADEFDKAGACSERLGEVNIRLKRISFAVKAFITASYIYRDGNDYENTIRCSLKVVELAKGDKPTIEKSYRHLARYYKQIGNMEKQVEYLIKTAGAAQANGNNRDAYIFYHQALELFEKLGDNENADKFQEQLEILSKKIGGSTR